MKFTSAENTPKNNLTVKHRKYNFRSPVNARSGKEKMLRRNAVKTENRMNKYSYFVWN